MEIGEGWWAQKYNVTLLSEEKIKINPALLSGDKMLIAYKLYDTNECVYVHVLCVCINCMCVANVFVCVCTCLYALCIVILCI